MQLDEKALLRALQGAAIVLPLVMRRPPPLLQLVVTLAAVVAFTVDVSQVIKPSLPAPPGA